MKKLLLLCAVVFGLLVLSGCGQRDPDLVGVWTWDDSPYFVTTFNEDGTGFHTLDWGYGTQFTWTTSRGNINWNYTNQRQVVYTPYSIEGDLLLITMADGTVFRYLRNP